MKAAVKSFGALFFVLICILLAVFWFVNRELQGFFTLDAQSNAVFNTDGGEEIDGWKFAVIGDTEDVRPINEQMVADMAVRGLDFVVHVGDLASTGEERETVQVLDLFAELPVPTYYVPGNNDLIYDETIERRTVEQYRTLVNEETYYSVNHKNAHLVLLDNSYRRYGFPGEELDWLADDLENPEAQAAAHTFLFFHRPLDLPGQAWFGDDETPDSRVQNELFKELIALHPITRIFNGHIHTTLSYSLGDIPVTVTGGGGALPQDIFGGADNALFHYYIVTVPNDDALEPVLELVEF